MAAFPDLEPATRDYNFGTFALTEEPSPSAGIVRFRHGAIPAAYQLTLGYAYLTNAEANLIRDHYSLQSGGFISFTLPAIIWNGHTSSINIVPSGTQWRYTTPPEEQQLSAGYVNLTVALESDGIVNLLYILQSNGASLPAVAPFASPIFTGNSPFILNAGGASPTIILKGGSAD